MFIKIPDCFLTLTYLTILSTEQQTLRRYMHLNYHTRHFVRRIFVATAVFEVIQLIGPENKLKFNNLNNVEKYVQQIDNLFLLLYLVLRYNVSLPK